ncbi:chaperonin 10-like protein [Penicillium riverlandense]|uniref:chaperonin 10-like protein n=1 Tax=Penicillium riverlandense TaxID=1903569 RepID=UPI002547AF19|nr:chaperonin 10-like protein [Penicillium riverlandense]KAJ5819428.1 chaperonin 10-like protein [Penicillium riverlandense]
MTTHKAILISEAKKDGLVPDRLISTLRDDYILVKTVSVGLNPTDRKHVAYLSPPGVLVECDYRPRRGSRRQERQETIQEGRPS